jgi:uncharacterized membrane protein
VTTLVAISNIHYTEGNNMSNLVTMSVYAAVYDQLEDAESDYKAVKSLYYDWSLMDTFDAAVIRKDENGRVKIVKKHEQPTRDLGWKGAGWGLATGLVIALFPGAALGTGLLAATTGAGAAIGALAGHAAGGISRADLKELGEGLDRAQAGLVVVTATDVGQRVADALKSAKKVIKKEIKTEEKELEKELKEAS